MGDQFNAEGGECLLAGAFSASGRTKRDRKEL